MALIKEDLMSWKTILLTGVVVVLAGGLAAWQVWEAVAPAPVEPWQAQSAMLQKIESLRDEVKALKQTSAKDHEEYMFQIAGMKKQLEDQRKYLLIYKNESLAAKGPTLNADQDIHKFVESALREEPVREILSTPDLVERARKIGLTTLKVQK
jgi:hypothetical protein